jgi:hypothetical protein
MKNKTILTVWLIAIMSGMALVPTVWADGFNPMNMMNPSKWMGGNKNSRDDYSNGQGYGAPVGYGYGAPGYGYGAPGYGVPAYGYATPGYGGYAVPNYGGVPSYGYATPGYGYGTPGQQQQGAPNFQSTPPIQ